MVDEIHQLLNGAVQLSDDVLDRQHHAQCQVAVDYSRGSQCGHKDILQLIDKDAPGFLILRQIECLHIHVEQVGLYIFPFPPFALLAPLQFDLLHTRDKLVHHITIDTQLLKHLVIQLAALLQEHPNPNAIKDASGKEDKENGDMVDEQYDGEDDEREGRKDDGDRLIGEEVLDTSMVFDAL